MTAVLDQTWGIISLADFYNTCSITPQQLTDSKLVGNLDVAIDCSGRVEAVSQAIRVLRKAGRLVLMGLVMSAEVGLPLVEVTTKELEIKGAWLNPNTFEEAIDLAADHKDALRTLKTEIFGLDNIAAAFKRALSQDVHKVLVRP